MCMIWYSDYLFYFAPILNRKQQVIGGNVHGECTYIRPCKLLIIYRKRSAIAYKRVVMHKLLKYTEYAMQLLWKNAPVKPLLDIHYVCLQNLFTFTLRNLFIMFVYKICLHLLYVCDEIYICMYPVRYLLIGELGWEVPKQSC